MIRLTLCLLLLALPAHAGYREMARQVVDYQPPQLYRDLLDASANEPVLLPRAEPELPAAPDPLDALRAEQQRWQTALRERSLPAGFHVPDATALERWSAAARDPQGVAVALDDGYRLVDLEALVWLRHPGVAAAERRLGAALQRYGQAANLDEVLRRYQAFTEALMPGVGPMKGREPAQMAFPYPDMVALKGQVVTQEVRAAVETLEIARRDALTRARTVYWNLGYLQDALRVTGEMERLLGDLEAVATTRYESGRSSFQDVVKVRIALATLVEERRTLEQRRGNAVAALRRLLAVDPGLALGAPAREIPPAEVPVLEALLAQARQRRQELRRLDARIGKMERMLRMGELRLHADPTLNLSVYQGAEVLQSGSVAMQEPFATTTAASMGAGAPTRPWYASGEAYLRETREKLGALREQRRDLEAMVLLEVREAWFALDRGVREQGLYAGSVVELSATALDVSTRGYETGGVMFADVIASYTDWLKAVLGAERRRADIGVARARLAAAVGADLDGANGVGGEQGAAATDTDGNDGSFRDE